MKNIFLAAVVLFFTVPLFAQTKTAHKEPQKTNSKTPDTNIEKKHAPRTVRVVVPQPVEALKAIEANMVDIPGGSFIMGCTEEQDTDCYKWENPPHVVTVSHFYLSKFAVTQKEWEAIVGPNPYTSKNCPDCPVENVSWYDAQVFINKLNQMSDKNYRLPTEAEWEFAARGGPKNAGHKYAGDDNVNAVAWSRANSGKETHPVGQKKPNELGLFDMCGNVWQWCSDWFNAKYYTPAHANNPTGPVREEYRVVRGGSWWSEPSECRVSNRDRYPPGARDDDVGFRLARD